MLQSHGLQRLGILPGTQHCGGRHEKRHAGNAAPMANGGQEMIGTLITKYHHLRAIENGPGDDDVCHQAAMSAMDALDDIEERLNAILKTEGVTVKQIVKAFT